MSTASRPLVRRAPVLHHKLYSNDKQFEQNLSQFQQYFNLPDPTVNHEQFKEGSEVTLWGYLGPRRNMSKRLAFLPLEIDNGPSINLVSKWEQEESDEHRSYQALKKVPKYSSVSVTGKISTMKWKTTKNSVKDTRYPSHLDRIDIEVSSVHVLNPLPKDIVVSRGVQFSPKDRHLQLRFNPSLRQRLYFRDYLTRQARHILAELAFFEVETPILFKSTPEGAREFVVPTRQRGKAFALPQSPQQYKQALMASGVPSYFQFARCFRDEDLRADRQPEFTQLDMEMAFSTGEDVMRTTETLIKTLYSKMAADFALQSTVDGLAPVHRSKVSREGPLIEYPAMPEGPFERIPYETAMWRYGIDKPDLRIPNQICRIDSIVPDSFVRMITDLEHPIVEACRFRLGQNMNAVRNFIISFMDNIPLDLKSNSHGAPTIIISDSSKPLHGFSSLGHECASILLGSDPEWAGVSGHENGDILLIQARPNEPFSGGSTNLGVTRSLFYNKAVEAELLHHNPSFRFLWVTDFPLFSPNDADGDLGQGGAAGFSSTHHPFTAPKSAQDFEYLHHDPLKARADHYDLVVNGVELGGGSRRIHIAEVQEFVMRHVLRMSDERVKDFDHLLNALRAGCPPHAGLALGWDRLVATFSGTESIRDVIAFPKSMKGEDLFAMSPGKLTKEQLETYHLEIREKNFTFNQK